MRHFTHKEEKKEDEPKQKLVLNPSWQIEYPGGCIHIREGIWTSVDGTSYAITYSTTGNTSTRSI